MSDNDSQPVKVLVIDDSADTLVLMKALFEKVGGTVTVSANASEGLNIALASMDRKDPFDLIVVDIMMPGQSGNSVARELRNMGFKGKIVAFTANATMAGRGESKTAGIDAYFAKQIFKKELASALINDCRSTRHT